MKAFLAMTVLFTSVNGFAATSLNDFLGTYRLVNQKVEGETFCFERVSVAEDADGTVGFYGPDMSYGPMIKAELNGAPRQNSGSHGEAMSSRKGQDSVTLKNDILTFTYTGINKFMGLPVSREKETVALKLAADGKTLALTRTTFEGVASGIGSKGKALCVYSK